MTLKDKSYRLVELRQVIAETESKQKEALAPLKLERDAIQEEIMKNLKRSGQFSARFDFGTVSRAVRKTLQVLDEKKVIETLKSKGLDGEYTSIQLNDLFTSSLAKEIVKSGEALEGTEIVEKEYISVSKPSAKEEKRKVNLMNN
ncbi:MAG: hypothetical protein COY66_05755 [Candidatus Kerfeldbacteria bacterium CG_4_10_14_0_8_um_filter_42_10]|uniref:Uncharacterized protein n=1 Tax=Candidatus Kerfeldbacteria bacterium CG_4_10_14_0_8_um_filter_42_10 TaxID=2014248 RepID=A0A2M7RGD3_9BACT|nr:MAG: hypothetical protein COY66_05755 [Candidatus Kerfeldbacteria bacterium CG_4_10_14_0_8_um_filter_42_10]